MTDRIGARADIHRGVGEQMDDVLRAEGAGPGHPVSLRDRSAAAIAITEFLRIHSRSAPRPTAARVFGAAVLSHETRTLYFDVIGQLAVAGALDQLDAGWVVLHAIPTESRETAIDHLVIGPGGVFTLSSNYHARQTVSVADRSVRVGGTRVNHIRNTEFDIGRVERRLTASAGQPIHVEGVVVVVGSRSLVVRDVPKDIAVVRADELVQWLRSRPSALEPACVSTVAEIADRPATWVLGDFCITDDRRLLADFDAVHREVVTATRVHRLWLVAVAAGLIGILVVAAWGVIVQAVVG